MKILINIYFNTVILVIVYDNKLVLRTENCVCMAEINNNKFKYIS